MDIVEKRFVEKPRIWKKFGSTFTKEKTRNNSERYA